MAAEFKMADFRIFIYKKSPKIYEYPFFHSVNYFMLNKKEIACCHENREHIFLVFNKLPGSLKSAKLLFIISMKFPIDAFYLNFGTLAGLWPWAIGPSLKIEFL
jgi:hypothetical protein